MPAAAAPSTPQTICIDSDDEAGSNGPPWRRGVGQPLPTTASGGELGQPPSERIVCQMMVPQGATPEQPSQQHRRMRLVGVVLVTLRSGDGCAVGSGVSSAREAELEILRRGPVADGSQAEACTRVPASSISHMEVRSDGMMIILKVHPPVEAGELVTLRANVDQEVGLLEQFALVPRANEVRDVLSTLRWWLPHVVVQGPLTITAKVEEAAVLRLEGIALTARDIGLLGDEQCLNDSVLDFFLRLAIDVVAPPRLRGDLYVASTFFFQKLTSGGVQNGQEGWENVARWTRSLPGGLLAQRFVVVPINEQNLHWWLAVICHPRRALTPAHDGEPLATLGEAPRIVCLDSFLEPPPKQRATGFLRGYIWREWCERHQNGAQSLDFNHSEAHRITSGLKAVEADVPKQANCYDCGIFVLEYLLHLLQSRSALAGLGLAPHRHWFGQALVSHRRRRLRWIAAALQAEAQRRSEPDVGRLLQDEGLRAAVAGAFTDQPNQKRKGSP